MKNHQNKYTRGLFKFCQNTFRRAEYFSFIFANNDAAKLMYFPKANMHKNNVNEIQDYAKKKGNLLQVGVREFFISVK